jgi:Skp family chaperone for outer membrane proteins
VPTIVALLVALIAALEPALADVKRVTEIVDAQHAQVSHIEAMVQRIQRRSQVLERIVVDLQSKADEAMRALADPDDKDRGPLAKAREAFTGG